MAKKKKKIEKETSDKLVRIPQSVFKHVCSQGDYGESFGMILKRLLKLSNG